MAVTGPTVAGGNAVNNSKSLVIKPSAIPENSLIVVAALCERPATDPMTISDSAGNSYKELLAGSQAPGSFTTLWTWSCFPSLLVPTSGSISLALPSAGQIVASLLYYVGSVNNIRGRMVAWQNTDHPSLYLDCLKDETQLAILGVNAPGSDAFAQDSNWSADIGGGIGADDYRIHGGGHSTPDSAIGVTYAPVLGAARDSVGLLISFR